MIQHNLLSVIINTDSNQLFLSELFSQTLQFKYPFRFLKLNFSLFLLQTPDICIMLCWDFHYNDVTQHQYQ